MAILSHLLVVCFIFIDSFLLVHPWMSCCGGVRGIMLVAFRFLPPHIYTYLIALKRLGAFAYSSK